jgi:hypothetical protein
MGPRPEHVEEFKRESGQNFHIYEFGNFIRIAAEHHPEIKQDLDAVEKSLRLDNDAKEMRLKNEADRQRMKQLLSLEDKRDDLIALLSGAPDTMHNNATSMDRLGTRERLKEIEEHTMQLDE